MTVMQEQEIARYVDRVRQALADLPPAVRDQLVEDLPEHLAEVAAEGTGPLVDRLGTPEAYAADLRAAAGVDAPPAARNLDARISAAVAKVRGWLQAADTRIGPIIGYARASDFLRLLRPAWWVLRGYLAVMLFTAVTDDLSYGLMPHIDGSRVAGLLLLAVAVVGSIWLGRRSGTFTRWPRLAVHAGSALAFLFGLVLLVEQPFRPSGYVEYTPAYNPYGGIQDIYVYDRQGRLVEGARLFDQNGDPIRIGGHWCPEAREGAEYMPNGELVWRGYPYCPNRAPFQFVSPSSASGPGTPAATPTTAPSGQPSTQPTSIAPATPSPTG